MNWRSGSGKRSNARCPFPKPAKEPVYLCGLFDFSDYWDIVCVVSQVLDLPKDEVHERLFYEARYQGWNVSRSAHAFGVTPHVYNKRMKDFYGNTDAFVFELLVSHLGRACQEIDRRVIETIESHFNGRRDLQILVLGDGIGTDSLRFAEMGYNVAYFEFKGCSSRLAIYRFRRRGLDDQITTIHRPQGIPSQQFDVAVCREVLEHVSDPPGVIESIWECLQNEGIAIITESFGRIEPLHPTHLATNEKYAGKTQQLFVDEGFHLLKSFPSNSPMVFQKTEKSDQSRFNSIDEDDESQYIVRDMVRRAGRHLLRLIQF